MKFRNALDLLRDRAATVAKTRAAARKLTPHDRWAAEWHFVHGLNMRTAGQDKGEHLTKVEKNLAAALEGKKAKKILTILTYQVAGDSTLEYLAALAKLQLIAKNPGFIRDVATYGVKHKLSLANLIFEQPSKKHHEWFVRTMRRALETNIRN